MQTVQESPLNLSLTLTELLKKDTIKFELIPEKKGLFLKHVEYQVTSEVSDFRGGIKVHPKSKNVLIIYPPSSYPRCRWACFFTEHIWRNVALHNLPSNGFSAVNGCRQNESKQLIKTSEIYIYTYKFWLKYTSPISIILLFPEKNSSCLNRDIYTDHYLCNIVLFY